MTQLPLAASLADRIRAWGSTSPRTSFASLCDAFPSESATDMNAAAREAGVLQWTDDVGFYVAAPLDVSAL